MKLISYLFCFLIMFPAALWSQNAPVTNAGRVIDATPGDQSVPVPVYVSGFNEIGQLLLTMKFDTTRVQFVSATPTTSLSGMTINYTSPPSGKTQGKLVFSWTGASNVTLADESVLADLVFYYVTGTGILNWSYILDAICQYKTYDNGNLVLLNDSPEHEYYLNGGISNRTAPYTFAPVIAGPVPGNIPVTVTVNNFTTIGGFTLSLDYDTTIITYLNSFTKNPAFGSAFQVGDNPGTDGKRIIVMQWFGGSVTLADGSTLCTLNFSYPSANCNPCALEWNESGPSCEFTDNLGNVLIDMPREVYYSDGIIAAGLYPTWTGIVDSDWDKPENWNECGVPDNSRIAIIPAVSPNASPIVTFNSYCDSVILHNGAELTIGQAGTLIIGNP